MQNTFRMGVLFESRSEKLGRVKTNGKCEYISRAVLYNTYARKFHPAKKQRKKRFHFRQGNKLAVHFSQSYFVSRIRKSIAFIVRERILNRCFIRFLEGGGKAEKSPVRQKISPVTQIVFSRRTNKIQSLNV